jgi:hypothetical protein
VADGGTRYLPLQDFCCRRMTEEVKTPQKGKKWKQGMMFYITFSVSLRLTPFPHRGKGIFTLSVTIVTTVTIVTLRAFRLRARHDSHDVTFNSQFLICHSRISCIFAKSKLEIMPTLFYYFGLKFYFYSNDHLPIHVHVSIDNSEARYLVYPEIKLVENRGLKLRELRLAEFAIEENREIIIARWKEYFKDKNNGNNL